VRVALLAAIASLHLLAGEPVYEISGKVEPVPSVRAVVSLHATTTPLAFSISIGPDGKYRFKKVPAGTYTLGAFIAGKGEVHRTIDVGPALANAERRILVDLDANKAIFNPDRATIVTTGELSVPDAARREYAAAQKALARGDHNRAERHLQKALEISPDYAGAWNHLGTIAYQTGRYPEAERHFRRARQADPLAFEPLVNLGGVLLTLGRYHEARLLNLAAVARKPKDALAQSQLGLSYLKLNQFQLAETHLSNAVQLDPGHFTNPQVFLAEIYLRRNNKPKAAEQLADFLKHHPDWPQKSQVEETIKFWSR
jgi:tetratricopeptide (TPR) repeat protein